MADEDFKVTLLDTPEVVATAFPRSGKEGQARSIKAVPEGWVRPASTHISLARILTPDFPWRWFNVNNESAHPEAEKEYGSVKKGEAPYVIIVNGQTFSHDPDAMLAYVRGKGTLDGRTNVGLVQNSIPLEKGYSDQILGEHLVWAFKEGKMQKTVVPMFTVDQYTEVQKDPNFLKQNPVFIGIFTEEQAAQYRHDNWLRLWGSGVYSPDPRLIEHVPSHMQAGTQEVFVDLLRVAADAKQYDTFYAGMPKLPKGSGRVGYVSDGSSGFDFDFADYYGCSFGVSAGGALDALVDQYIALREPSQRLQKEIIQAVLTTPVGRLEEGLREALPQILSRYSSIKAK